VNCRGVPAKEMAVLLQLLHLGMPSIEVFTIETTDSGPLAP
jgi:hypothetical protein